MGFELSDLSLWTNTLVVVVVVVGVVVIVVVYHSSLHSSQGSEKPLASPSNVY